MEVGPGVRPGPARKVAKRASVVVSIQVRLREPLTRRPHHEEDRRMTVTREADHRVDVGVAGRTGREPSGGYVDRLLVYETADGGPEHGDRVGPVERGDGDDQPGHRDVDGPVLGDGSLAACDRPGLSSAIDVAIVEVADRGAGDRRHRIELDEAPAFPGERDADAGNQNSQRTERGQQDPDQLTHALPSAVCEARSSPPPASQCPTGKGYLWVGLQRGGGPSLCWRIRATSPSLGKRLSFALLKISSPSRWTSNRPLLPVFSSPPSTTGAH